MEKSVELQVRNVSKRYGKFEALKDFSYTMTPGIYGLLGPNGAGKSTLMNIVAGVLLPTAGEVLYNGKQTAQLGGEFRRALGFLPQTSGYYKSFTAVEFLEYVASLKGLTDKKRIREEIVRLLEAVNLTDASGKKLGGFSGGMRQRIGIAQALLGNPEILVFDEPTAGLDPKERIRFRNIISELAFDRIVILATHIVSDIEMTANRILIIRKGELIQSGNIGECVSVLNGKVFTAEMPQQEFGAFGMQQKVVSVFRSGDDAVQVRFISEKAPDFPAEPAPPSLEDLYLYFFEDANRK